MCSDKNLLAPEKCAHMTCVAKVTVGGANFGSNHTKQIFTQLALKKTGVGHIKSENKRRR